MAIATHTAASPLTQAPYFQALADRVCALSEGHAGERISLYLQAEQSQFIRFNRSAVRQATQVSQGSATLTLVSGARRMAATLTLTGQAHTDLRRLNDELATLRSLLPDVPEDPYLLLPDALTHSHRHEHGTLPSADEVVQQVAEAAQGLDFVGFYAAGPVVRAFADSSGQRHWHHVESFHIEWCLYLRADQAVKASHAGAHWVPAAFRKQVAQSAVQLRLLARPAVAVQPGEWRAYLAPAAVAELLGTLGWSGFSARARRTDTSSLSRLAAGLGDRLHSSVRLDEDTAAGLAPAFTPDGFVKPGCVPLLGAGGTLDTLNSPRSAREYGLAANGANGGEAPESLSLTPGMLREAEVLGAIGDGLYVSNLWYLNYSDRSACRMTGMTRFACFRVQGGELVAPLPVMRFDDAFTRLFGVDGLLALDEHAVLVPDNSSYGQRALGSVTTPGALVQGWRLTL
jgi:predicted Zn-dependent protease